VSRNCELVMPALSAVLLTFSFQLSRSAFLRIDPVSRYFIKIRWPGCNL